MIKETGDEQHQDSERHCGAGAARLASSSRLKQDLTDVSRLLKKLAVEAALGADSDDHQAMMITRPSLRNSIVCRVMPLTYHSRTRNFSRLIENVSKTDREARSNDVEETYIYA